MIDAEKRGTGKEKEKNAHSNLIKPSNTKSDTIMGCTRTVTLPSISTAPIRAEKHTGLAFNYDLGRQGFLFGLPASHACTSNIEHISI